ncbi:hypothetical protein CLV42_101362 [Chitinophaga ginsengisoli]|uniref:Uncharacterized protein n=1 Tax=Chitinophaga ginsengisoli TaxID=363837 RepID=A0A2P8GNR8_9BACT|nr:hypothetical protein CLV42_101362 [Chitinophaga ginsengisoli]
MPVNLLNQIMECNVFLRKGVKCTLFLICPLHRNQKAITFSIHAINPLTLWKEENSFSKAHWQDYPRWL